MIQIVRSLASVAPLFAGWQETIIWSCLQGEMGEVYAPVGEAPVSALATLGDFTFLAGEPREELVRFLPPNRRPDYHILVPQNEGWARCIAGVYPQARRVTRYATEKTGMLFDRTRLARLAARLSPSDQLCPVNATLYQRCLASPWSRDLVAQFPTPAVFARRGLGMAVLRRGRLVAGAASYSRYRGGIEVEVDTHPACRGQGLATAASAALLLACLDRGLYPSWDAHTRQSLALAEKLGYRYSHAYPAYEVAWTP